MKFPILLCSLLLVTGCAQIKTVTNLLPRDHDPALASAFVEMKIQINTLSCEDKILDNWPAAEKASSFVKEYTSFRDDPQKETALAIYNNIQKAYKTESTSVCDHWLKLTDVRIKSLEAAWKGR